MPHHGPRRARMPFGMTSANWQSQKWRHGRGGLEKPKCAKRHSCFFVHKTAWLWPIPFSIHSPAKIYPQVESAPARTDIPGTESRFHAEQSRPVIPASVWAASLARFARSVNASLQRPRKPRPPAAKTQMNTSRPETWPVKQHVGFPQQDAPCSHGPPPSTVVSTVLGVTT